MNALGSYRPKLKMLRGPGAGHFDVARVLLFLGGLACIAFAGIHLWRDHVFSVIEFGTGYGLLLAGGLGGTAVKDTAVAKVNQMDTQNSPGEAP